jgi:hypothetical protein
MFGSIYEKLEKAPGLIISAADLYAALIRPPKARVGLACADYFFCLCRAAYHTNE